MRKVLLGVVGLAHWQLSQSGGMLGELRLTVVIQAGVYSLVLQFLKSEHVDLPLDVGRESPTSCLFQEQEVLFQLLEDLLLACVEFGVAPFERSS